MPAGVLPRRFFLRAGSQVEGTALKLPDDKVKQVKLESLEHLHIDKWKEPCRARKQLLKALAG
jgi:hypothetical protein